MWNQMYLVYSINPTISIYYTVSYVPCINFCITNKLDLSKQAKTTKKIVLRLQCQGCKHVSQHSIKVIFLQSSLFTCFCFCFWHLCWCLVCSLLICRGANILRLVETRRERALLSFKCSYLFFLCCFCFNLSSNRDMDICFNFSS